jgi:hypothetical protein
VRPANPTRDTHYDGERRPHELPPGEFLTDQLQSDCTRFLEEIKNVVRRRNEAGLSRERYG